MLCHAFSQPGRAAARPSYRPTVEVLEERTLLSGAGHLVRQINAAANHLLQMTATLTPQMQAHCGDAPTFVTQVTNLVNQVQAEASAAKARFRHGGRGAKHPGAVLRLEKRLIADFQAFLNGGGLPDGQVVTNLTNDSAGLQRQVVAAFPQSIANACYHPTLPTSLFGGGFFLF
jgi:hypothetical protein